MAASIRDGQSRDLRLPYASLRVTLRVGTQKQPTFMHLLTGLRLQHPPRGNSATVSVTIVGHTVALRPKGGVPSSELVRNAGLSRQRPASPIVLIAPLQLWVTPRSA